MTGCSVVIADDHPMFREGLRFSLSQDPEITILGEASNGREALDLVATADPDIIVMDINMPVIGGLEATRTIAADHPRTRILVLTMYDDDASVFAAMRAGAAGYLVKGSSPEEILSAVRAVGHGQAVFGMALASRVLGYFELIREPQRQDLPELSAREREVLDHLARGLTNQQIANELFISPITVRNHVSSILGKLHVSNRHEATIRARWGE